MIAYYLKMTSIGAGEYAFHIPELIARQPFSVPGGPTTFQQFLFWALFIGFAIKIPVFPFHTWLPDAHVEAPTAISVILAGVLLKIGAYGLLRLSYPLVPEVAGSAGVMWFLAVLGVVNIVYGALCTLGQSDFKRLVAYSSISHMGYVLLGIATLKSEGINGAIFQMFAHGISSAMMFLIVGVLYDRARHREVSRFGGIGLKMPVYFALTIISFFASLGLPSTIGFIGQLMVLLGAFSYHKLLTAIAASGMLLTAGCFIWTLQRVYSGEPKAEHKNFDDCNQWELAALAPLAAIAIIFGIIPSMVIGKYLGSTEALLETFTNAGIL
jgi:NADH-quinone oxidoreductase subunit M